eukprot:g9517.t3
MELSQGYIQELLQLEREASTLPWSIERSAKVNLLKFLQVNAVKAYERAYTGLYFDVRRNEGFDALSSVPEKNHSGGACLQPMEAGSVEDYLCQAETAKVYLDRLVDSVAAGIPGREGIPAPIKTEESTRRKADKLGGIRYLTDLARASFVCETPLDLVEVFSSLTATIGKVEDILRVSNGFVRNYGRNGYRDVKVIAIVAGHACEIQLHLRSFYDLKAGQHEVYEWSRTLKVTAEIQAEHLFRGMQSDILELMIQLATVDWKSTGVALAPLLHTAGRYAEAHDLQSQIVASCARRDREARIRQGQESSEWHSVAQDLATALANLALTCMRQGEYNEADALLMQALATRKESLGPEHPQVAATLHNRAGVWEAQGKYEEAEGFCVEAMEIFEKTLGRGHPNVASALNNRAALLRKQGKYAEAAPLYEQALDIEKAAVDPESEGVALKINNQAQLMQARGKYVEAEPLYDKAIEIWERIFGSEHPVLATALRNKAALFSTQDKFEQAESLLARALDIWEKTVGPHHPSVATVLNDLAFIMVKRGEHERAKPMYERSLAILEMVQDPDHSDIAQSLNDQAMSLTLQEDECQTPTFGENAAIDGPSAAKQLGRVLGSMMLAIARNVLGLTLTDQAKYIEAEPLYAEAIAFGEQTLGEDHPDLATWRYNLGLLYSEQEKYDLAEPLLKQSLSVRQNVLGADHTLTLTSRAAIAHVYVGRGFFGRASPILEEVVRARERVQGRDHPDVATSLNNWASVLQDQGEYDKAYPLYQRALRINEKIFGPDNPTVATDLNNLATLLEKQEMYTEAEEHSRRGIKIDERTLGPDHPYLAKSYTVRARIMRAQAKYAEGERLIARAMEIGRKTLDSSSPTMVAILKEKEELSRAQPVGDVELVGTSRGGATDPIAGETPVAKPTT